MYDVVLHADEGATSCIEVMKSGHDGFETNVVKKAFVLLRGSAAVVLPGKNQLPESAHADHAFIPFTCVSTDECTGDCANLCGSSIVDGQ